MVLVFCDHSLIGNLSLFQLTFKILPALLCLAISCSGVYNYESLMYNLIFHLAIISHILFSDVNVYGVEFH